MTTATSTSNSKQTAKKGPGRPATVISRDQFRAAVKDLKATARVEACNELAKKFGCSWLTVYKIAAKKGYKLPMGHRGRPKGSVVPDTMIGVELED